MATAQLSAIDSSTEKTNRVLKEIEQAFGWPPERRHQSYAALSTVLHCLRDRLPIGEAAQLGAQLPLLIRGVYYDGWNPGRVPMKMDRAEFLGRIRQSFRFEVDGGPEQLVRVVTRALRQYVTDGEWDDVTSTMPGDLRAILT